MRKSSTVLAPARVHPPGPGATKVLHQGSGRTTGVGGEFRLLQEAGGLVDRPRRQEAVRHLPQFGADVQIAGPPEARTEMSRAVAEWAGLYGAA
ncbi:hypothetical protein [Streptomyces sp. NPDC054987]